MKEGKRGEESCGWLVMSQETTSDSQFCSTFSWFFAIPGDQSRKLGQIRFARDSLFSSLWWNEPFVPDLGSGWYSPVEVSEKAALQWVCRKVLSRTSHMHPQDRGPEMTTWSCPGCCFHDLKISVIQPYTSISLCNSYHNLFLNISMVWKLVQILKKLEFPHFLLVTSGQPAHKRNSLKLFELEPRE